MTNNVQSANSNTNSNKSSSLIDDYWWVPIVIGLLYLGVAYLYKLWPFNKIVIQGGAIDTVRSLTGTSKKESFTNNTTNSVPINGYNSKSSKFSEFESINAIENNKAIESISESFGINGYNSKSSEFADFESVNNIKNNETVESINEPFGINGYNSMKNKYESPTEFFTDIIDEPDTYEQDFSELNENVHVTVNVTLPPENVQYCKEFILERTIEETGTVIQYKIVRDEEYDREKFVLFPLKDANDNNLKFTDSPEDEEHILSPNDVLVNNSQFLIIFKGQSVGKYEQSGKNMIAMKYKIDPVLAGLETVQDTVEEILYNDDGNQVGVEFNIDNKIYSADFSSVQEDLLTYVELSAASSSIAAEARSTKIEENPFYLGMKRSGVGALNKQFMFVPNGLPDGPIDEDETIIGTFTTRSIFNPTTNDDEKSNDNMNNKYNASYFGDTDNGGVLFKFINIAEMQNLSSAHPPKDFIISFTSNDVTYYCTHETLEGNGEFDLQFTNNIDNAKRFLLIEPSADSSGEGSFILCPTEAYVNTRDRYIVSLDSNIKSSKRDSVSEHFDKKIKIYHFRRPENDMRNIYCVYGPVLDTEVEITQNQFYLTGLNKNPGNSELVYKLNKTGSLTQFPDTKAGKVEAIDFAVDRTDTDNLFTFEKVNNKIGTYYIKNSDNRYLCQAKDSNNNFVNRIVANSGSNTSKFTKLQVKLLQYPTTAALRTKRLTKEYGKSYGNLIMMLCVEYKKNRTNNDIDWKFAHRILNSTNIVNTDVNHIDFTYENKGESDGPYIYNRLNTASKSGGNEIQWIITSHD